MSHLNELFKSDQAKKILNNRDTIQNLQKAPEAKRLMEIIQQQSGGDFDQLSNYVSSGDTGPLMKTIQTLMNDPESQKLLETISKKLTL